MDEQCESCGMRVTYCSLCGLRRFHIGLQVDDGEIVEYQSCARCDLMTRWPMVLEDQEMSLQVHRAIHPSNLPKQ